MLTAARFCGCLLLVTVGIACSRTPSDAPGKDKAEGSKADVTPRNTITTGLSSLFFGLGLSPQARFLIVTEGDKAQIWDVEQNKKLHEFKPGLGSGVAVAIS